LDQIVAKFGTEIWSYGGGGGVGGLQLVVDGIDEWEIPASVAHAEEQRSLDNDDIGGGGGG
jgi:hypothetical protein